MVKVLDHGLGPSRRLVQKIGATHLVQQLLGNGRRLPAIAAQIDHVLDEVARMTRTHLQPATLAIMHLTQLKAVGIVVAWMAVSSLMLRGRSAGECGGEHA